MAKSRGYTRRIGRAGEYYVAAELNRRPGIYATSMLAIPPSFLPEGIDILAYSQDGANTAYIQVKTKGNFRNWQGQYLGHAWDLWKVSKNPNEGQYQCFSLYGTCDNHEHSVKLGSEDAPELQGRDGHYWVFVAIKDPPTTPPSYCIVPDTDVRRMLRKGHLAYLNRAMAKDSNNKGHRTDTHHSLHSGLSETNLEPYLGKWSLLGLDLADDGEDGP